MFKGIFSGSFSLKREDETDAKSERVFCAKIWSKYTVSFFVSGMFSGIFSFTFSFMFSFKTEDALATKLMVHLRVFQKRDPTYQIHRKVDMPLMIPTFRIFWQN